MRSARGSRARRAGRCLAALLAALGLLMLAVTFTPLVSWWSLRLAGQWMDPDGDVLVVLAGSTMGEGIVGYSSYIRCFYAVVAWRQGAFREVLLSGAGPQLVPVAASMADFLVAYGVPRGLIVLDTRANSTRESAVNCARLLKGNKGRIVLLTSDYHMYRAARAFRKAGLEVLPHPFPDGLKRAEFFEQRWSAFIDLVKETAKILYYRWKGWI